MCHAQRTLPVLVHVCHDNNDVSSHGDLVQSCLSHVYARHGPSHVDLRTLNELNWHQIIS